MADHPQDPIGPDNPDRSKHTLDDREADEGISELQARLNELQRSVELLGTQGVWASRDPSEGRRPPASPLPPPVPPVPPSAPPYSPADPLATPLAQPPVPTPVPGPSVTAEATAHTDDWTDDRIAGQPGISDQEASVAMVDAGPFADLVELRHFEDDLSSLTAVHDVRVRRYGQGRAMIEVGMAGPYDLTLELPRLGLPMDVAPAGPNELIIEFAPLPDGGPDVEAPVGALDAEKGAEEGD